MLKERIWYKFYLIKDAKKLKKISGRLPFTYYQMEMQKQDSLLFKYNYFKKSHLLPIY